MVDNDVDVPIYMYIASFSNDHILFESSFCKDNEITLSSRGDKPQIKYPKLFKELDATRKSSKTYEDIS